MRLESFREYLYSKFSFVEVYRRINGRKFSFMATRIRRYTSPNENFEYGYPHSNALIHFPFIKTVKMYFVAPICPATSAT